jgi:DNA repair exonuclease SbcCD ATPase subunit
MKLRSLAVNQFKKFTRPTRLDGIGDGLNVVVGPNELGKSTLLDALRAVLFEKYSSKAQAISALQNDRNKAAPVVELTFELGDGLYTITKRFMKKEYAHLSCPDGRLLEGDAAEDKLRHLLNFDEPGKTGANPETLGMWNILWVQQGQSFSAINLPESARSNVHSALESEVGTVLGGKRGRALPQAIEKQQGELVTSNGKPRGKYKKLTEDIDCLQLEIESQRVRRQDLFESFDKLAKALEDLASLSYSDRDDTLKRELNETRKSHTWLAELEAKIKAANSDLELKKHNLEQAQRAAEERRNLKDSIATEVVALEAARKQREEVDHQQKESRSQLDQLWSAVRQAEVTETKAGEAVSRAQRVSEAVRRYARIRALQDQYDKAEAAGKRLSEAQQKATAILVDDDAIKQIRGAEKELESVTSRLSAAATVVTIDIPLERLSGIEIDGEQLSAQRRSFQAIEAKTIAIPERGRIIIEPAIRDRDKLRCQEREAKAKLQNVLARAGAVTVNDAEDQYAEHQQLLQEAKLARQEIELHAPATREHEAGAQVLADYIEGLRQILAREKSELGLPELPELQDAENAFRKAQEHADAVRHSVEHSRAKLSGPEERVAKLQKELGTVCARYEASDKRLSELRRLLETAEKEQPDQELQARIEQAQAKVAAQEKAADALNAQRMGETLPQLETRIVRLERTIKDRRDKRENLKVEISRWKSYVEALEGAGLDEAIEQDERQLELYEKERVHYEREVKVLKLLLSTLRTAEREAKERYLSPVLNRVRPYLQYLFPGAEVTIDENLHIVGVVREAGYEEAFHHLSMGTQEQIAILVRLAFAEMLLDQSRPSTVILDDTLVFSDDQRIRRMFDILNTAAQKVQVIIFTCREQLFEEMGGRQLSLKPGKAEELRSA